MKSKRFFKVLLAVLIMTALLLPVTVFAADGDIFTADNIRYRVISESYKTVEVIHSSADTPVSNTADSTYSGSITIPAKVTNDNTEFSVIGIDTFAFIGANIDSITLPEGLQYIDGAAFASSKLQSIEIPASVTRLGGGGNNTPVFFNGGNGSCAISSITFAQGSQLETISNGAFEGCDDLTTLEIPAGVTDLGLDSIAQNGDRNLGVLDGWKNAKNVTFAKGSPYDKDENGVLYKGDTLCVALDDEISSVTVREGTKAIADNAFYVCTKLADINLPEGLETIGDGAFNYAPNVGLSMPDIPGLPSVNTPAGSTPANVVTQINIPATVTRIGQDFLKGGLKDDGSSIVIMQGSTPPAIGEGAFATEQGQTPSLIIYYPESAEEAYKNSDYPLSTYIENSGESAEQRFDLTLAETATVKVGETVTLTVTSTIPDGATLGVSSSNGVTAVLSEDNSTITVTGVSAGTATITATIQLNNGVKLTSADCAVTVTSASEPQPDPDPVRPSTPMYAVDTPAKVTGGTVTITPTRAPSGTQVTITAKSDKGYVLDHLTVTDSKGNRVKLTEKDDGVFTFRMPSSDVSVDVKFVRAASFVDVSRRDYFYDAVNWAVENGITDGTGNGRFSPDAPCTRAQVVTFLWRAAGSPKVRGNNPFTDVKTSDYYYDAVLWAVREGITVGTSGTTFSPDATVTRGQTATFLHRAAGEPAASGSSFTDVSASAYYAAAVSWAAREGITDGTGNGKFSPDAPCTRAQIVTFLYRAK